MNHNICQQIYSQKWKAADEHIHFRTKVVLDLGQSKIGFSKFISIDAFFENLWPILTLTCWLSCIF